VKERIITGICLLAVVIPLVYLGGYWFMGLILIATGIATWEMVNMHDSLNKTPMWIKGLSIVMTVAVIWIPGISLVFKIVAGFACVLILIKVILKAINDQGIKFHVFTLVYVGFAFRALLEIRESSLTLFIFLMAIVILTDSMAYFAGRFFGKRKLAPKISPKKTVEGAIGGWLAGAGFAVAFGLANDLFAETWVLVVLATGLPILSQIGDLVASALKRHYGIKDYGKIFPGHGGVMDRVDSQMLAAVLIYVILQTGGVV
jgi:phosphatidate cytidylyltransferase